MTKLGLLFLSALLFTSAFSLSACDEHKDEQADVVPKVIKLGVVPGPYREIVQKYLDPLVKEKGHSIELVEFTDWIQPDSALASGDIDANLFQHQAYLDGIVKNQKLKLSSVVNFPTLGIYVFSDKFSSLKQNIEGELVGIPNDPVNLARALRVARDLNLITLSKECDDQKASTADIANNPYELKFVPMEAAQLPRSLDSVGIAFVPGNYAYASNLSLDKAIGAENVLEPIKLVIAVQDKNQNTIGAFLKEAVLDPRFSKSIDLDPSFNKFSKPKWWPKN